MAISYPLQMPATPGPVRVTFSSVSSIGVSRSPFTYQSHVQAHQGKSWAAEVTLPTMERDAAEEWIAFLLSLNGQEGTFLLGDPAAKVPRGIATGVPRVNGAQSAQAKTLVTDGWTASTTDILKKGDYIQVGLRLYKLLTNATSDGSGNATLDIWPTLRESVADNDLILTTTCVGLFRLAQNIVPLFNADDAKMYNISFSAVEAV